MNQDTISCIFELSYTIIVIGLLCYFILRSQKLVHTPSKVYRHWILFGALMNMYSLSWLYTVYPIFWLAPGAAQLVGITLLHCIVFLVTAAPYGVVAFSFTKKIITDLRPFVFGSLLVISEIARSLIISLIYKGDGTTIGLHFTAGTIGNALSTTPLVEFAFFGGTFALTFVLGYLVYAVCSSERRHYLQHYPGILIALTCLHFFIPITLPPQGTSVGIVTTNFELPKNRKLSRDVYEKNEQILHTMTLSLRNDSFPPTFIVYPEDTRYTAGLSPKMKTDLLIFFEKTLFVDGNTITSKNGLSNFSILYSPKREIPLGRGKEFLLPFSEYVPYFFKPFFLFFVGKENLTAYEDSRSFAPMHQKKTVTFNSIPIATLICSEILSFSTIEKLRKEKPSIIFFQSELRIFHNNPWFIMHLRSFSKITAAQLRTTVISSASGAPSFVISPYGKILSFSETGMSTSTYIFK